MIVLEGKNHLVVFLPYPKIVPVHALLVQPNDEWRTPRGIGRPGACVSGADFRGTKTATMPACHYRILNLVLRSRLVATALHLGPGLVSFDQHIHTALGVNWSLLQDQASQLFGMSSEP